MVVTGGYFDGKSSKRHVVTLEYGLNFLRLKGDTIDLKIPEAELNIPPPLGRSARLIILPGGARCEIAFDDFAMVFPKRTRRLVPQLEQHWLAVSLSVMICFVVVAAAYFWGLPYTAEVAAGKLPAALSAGLDRQVLANFDNTVFEPSRLPEDRRQAIRQSFNSLAFPSGGKPGELIFRRSPKFGANAFTLPGGSIVVLDELVNLAGNNQEILAVLAHEAGHAHEHHAMRQLFQASAVGMFVLWYMGDISHLLSVMTTVLLEARYSREFERHADRYAVSLLHANHLSSRSLADMLEKLQNHSKDAKLLKQLRDTESFGQVLGYVSTHPDTEERIKMLRHAERP